MYIDILEKSVKPWIKSNYPPDINYVFQQDGAPAHAAKKTQKWLETNFVSFWDKDMWPPSFPDLNQLDYNVWACGEEADCNKPHSSVAALKSSIMKAWSNMKEDYIIKMCSAFRGRLEAVIRADGAHIK